VSKFFKRISLLFNPPAVGDVFFGDPFDLMCDFSSERVFYPIIDRQGQTISTFVFGFNTYRFTLETMDEMYATFRVEILVSNRNNASERSWLERVRPKRMWRKDFFNLLAEGRLIKTESQSLFK
jgi:hypothetical protein